MSCAPCVRLISGLSGGSSICRTGDVTTELLCLSALLLGVNTSDGRALENHEDPFTESNL